jgi:hypothetical protein
LRTAIPSPNKEPTKKSRRRFESLQQLTKLNLIQHARIVHRISRERRDEEFQIKMFWRLKTLDDVQRLAAASVMPSRSSARRAVRTFRSPAGQTWRSIFLSTSADTSSAERFDLIAPYKAYRVYREQLPTLAPKAAMLFRPAMLADLDGVGLWSNAQAIWSQWEGNLVAGPGAKLRADFAARSVPLQVIHTSGHASIGDLRRLSHAIDAAALIPIHTFAGDEFSAHFQNVTRRLDGEWWGV